MKHGKLLTLEMARNDVNNVEYKDEPDDNRVTATLRGKSSAKYTALGDKLKKIEELSAEIETLRLAVKDDTRGMIGELFDAADAVKTRVVITKSFIFRLNRESEGGTSYEYSKILAELEKKLTPSLIKVLGLLKEKFSKPLNRAPALHYDKVAESEEMAGESDDEFARVIIAWAKRYDKALENLKRAL